MKLTQKEAAEKRREKTALEQKRIELKKKVANHRDMSPEDVSGIADELRSISDQLDIINEALLDAPEPEHRNVVIPMEKRTKEINEDNYRSTTQYRDAFFRSFMNKRVAETDVEIMAFGKRAVTDMNGLSVTAGAEYLVPQTTLTQIQSIIVKYGRVYAAVTKYGFNGDVTIPIGTADAPVNNADGTDTLSFTFTEVTLNQQAIVATVSVKNLLLKNSIAGLETYLSMEIGKYIGLQLENYVLNGDPDTSKFEGIIHAYGVSEKYSATDWELINAVYGALESPYGDEGTWIMNRKTFFSRFRNMTDSEGRPLIATLPVTVGGAGAAQYFIDGRPVIFSTRMANDAFIYGDLSQYIVNESQELVIESDSSAGFAADKTVWRGKVYSGGKVLFVAQAFIYYTYEAA